MASYDDYGDGRAPDHDRARQIVGDAFLGNYLGGGFFRSVYLYHGPGGMGWPLVVKVQHEDPDCREFANIREWTTWRDVPRKHAQWLAPCEWISHDGRVLVMHWAKPLTGVPRSEWPEKVPEFLTPDSHAGNFGIYQGRIVAIDYGRTKQSFRLKKRLPNWADGE